ncbi:MAG: MFS transporter [Hyphomicrobiales bacterium]|nr:MFS transporter [Hyphomicrobiales bacterium]MCP5370503.1 MFS transporter [Hyphomicrobiales bacterium]
MAAGSASPQGRSNRAGLVAWCFYDWANSAFAAVIVTFVFATYFSKGVAATEEAGTTQWGYAMSLSALVLALMAPFMGAIADNSGRRKPWIWVFTLVCAAGTAALWFARPDPSSALLALVAVGIANLAFEGGVVFYNAMLADLAPRDSMGRWSGWGWGFGYVGGVACLLLALFGFVQTDTPLFGLDKAAAEHVRATGPLVAVWLLVFALPMLLVTPDRPATGMPAGAAVRKGMTDLVATLKKVREYRDIAWFLLARMIYIDGLNTLFAFGGIYAAGTFKMELAEVIQFGIAMNVTAGAGAIALAWVDDWIGPKRTILISLLGLVGLGTVLLIIESPTHFWIFGLILGAFVGPTQAASRSYMAHIAPAELRTEMFGLYAFSGKATAFLGPFLVGTLTLVSGSQRIGMSPIIVLMAVGMVLMLRVPDVRR